MLRFLALWLLLSVAVGFWARRIGRSGLSWFLTSALVSPIIGTILLLATQNLAARRGTYIARVRNSRAYRILFNTIMAVLVIVFLISALNRGGMKPIRIAHAGWTQTTATSPVQQNVAAPGVSAEPAELRSEDPGRQAETAEDHG